MTRTIGCSALRIRERKFDRKPQAILAKVDPVESAMTAHYLAQTADAHSMLQPT